MKKLLMILIVLIFTVINNSISQRTLPTIDHFNYDAGQLYIVGQDWSRISGTSNDLLVVDGNLTYAGYPMPATGRKIVITSSGADDDKLTFTAKSSVGDKIYVSFLLNVDNSTGLGTGAYFASIGSGTTSPVYGARLWIANGSVTGTNYKLGLSRNSNTIIGWSGDLTFGTTYLIVLYYEIVSGTGNDVVKLWINPDLSGTEPAPIVSGNQSGTADNSSIDGFFIRQTSGTPNASIDALRIGLQWADAPLPVQLSSFTGYFINNNSVKLEWETVSEVNNFGFYVEKFNPLTNLFVTIEESFQSGAGNSLEPRQYSWVDENAAESNLQYRLKQVDNDGLESYFGPIMLNPNSAENPEVVPVEFKLNQNYPNPFNPKTNITFTVANTGFTTLKVYNILGNEVSTLFNSVAEAGKRYNIEFNSSNLTSGIYFYKLSNSGQTQTRKMLILK